MSMETPVIYVWIGSRLPSWTSEFIIHCMNANPNRRFILITDFKQDGIWHRQNLKIHTIESPCKDIDEGFMERTEQGFWQNTSLRFPAIWKFCIDAGIEKFFHIELDNIIANIDFLEDRLSHLGCGIFAPRDNIDRVIGSFIYCNRLQCLLELIDIYKEAGTTNDMVALGQYAVKYPEHFWALPTESYMHNQHLFKLIDPTYCFGIFDAASIGQYMFGVDPIHRRYQPLRNCFVNENCKLDWRLARLKIENGLTFLGIMSDESSEKVYWHRIFNLHVHSKSYNAVREFYSQGLIYKRLLQGKSTVICNMNNYYLGPPKCIRDYILQFGRKLRKAMRLVLNVIREQR